MKATRFLCVLAIGAMTLNTVLWGNADEKSAAGKEQPAARKQTNSQFVMLKKLAGDWSGTARHGDHPASETTISYRLTSNGSALMETMFCESDHEMITMYHCHGDDVILTHYCAIGNQP